MSLKQMQFLDGASTGKQEPVRIMGFDCVCGRRMVVSAEQGVVPAPQRKPLSTEEIEQCCYETDNQMADHPQTWKWTEGFARAIEAAHGIKENT